MSKIFRNTNRIFMTLLLTFFLVLTVINVPTQADDDLKPDLVIFSMDCPDTINEEKQLNITIRIKNQGTKNISIGTIIEVGLYVDNILVKTKSTTNGLDINETTYMNLTWIAELGPKTKRLISVIVDHNNLIIESNENNNVWDQYIYVLEKETELKIIDFSFPTELRVNETAMINAEIINNGQATNNPVQVRINFTDEGINTTKIKYDGLDRDETHNFSFYWTPINFGSQTITLEIIYDDKTHDYQEKNVFVDVGVLDWWNENWHYQHFLVVKGNGNVESEFNFTVSLKNLGIYGQEFENDTIRIIQYLPNGTIVGMVDKYNFYEATDFNSTFNAKGNLIWEVSGISDEKFYCIYFDVTSNHGCRTEHPETQGMTSSGDAYISYFGFIDGWGCQIINPSNGSFGVINKPIDIIITTTAKAENITANIYWVPDESYNFTLELIDIENRIRWTYENFVFDKEGNWKIIIYGYDSAGYEPDIIISDFYIGKPDIELLEVNFETNWPPTSPNIYKNDTVTITAIMIAYNATVENVDVLLSIYDLQNNITVYETILTGLTLIKDELRNITFTWVAGDFGFYNVTVFVDPYDSIEERNESNNGIITTIFVDDWPNLAVNNIILPSITPVELERVSINVVVSNYGFVNAVNYEIRLYIEPASQEIMKYLDWRYSTNISVKNNESKQISLYWDSAEPGDWLVGAKILITDTKRDTDISNNRLHIEQQLTVRGIERTPPSISLIDVNPDPQDLGQPVFISANITDNSGLSSVKIRILNPNNVNFSSTMKRNGGSSFGYIFTETQADGSYTITIEAFDNTIHKNKGVETTSFEIKGDSTPPEISYFDAIHHAQLIDEEIKIICILTDESEIKSVEVTITDPDVFTQKHELIITSTGEFVYTDSFEKTGLYTFYIIAEDKFGNSKQTEAKTFWITTNIDDMDNDGIPDDWEEKYEFNPENPTDADNDDDGDGITNLEEYKAGTNPLKDIFIENASFRIRDNIGLIGLAIALFILILLFGLIGKRRRGF